MPRDVSRREAMRRALKAGAYAAPVIVASSTARVVSAASPAPTSLVATVTQHPDANFCANNLFVTIQLVLGLVFTLHNGPPNMTLAVRLVSSLPDGSIKRFLFSTKVVTDAAGNGSFSETATYFVDLAQTNGIVQGFPTSASVDLSPPGGPDTMLVSAPARLVTNQCNPPLPAQTLSVTPSSAPVNASVTVHGTGTGFNPGVQYRLDVLFPPGAPFGGVTFFTTDVPISVDADSNVDFLVSPSNIP